MKKLVCLLLLLGFVSLGFAQRRVSQKSALQVMVETERAFARMSEEQGTRPAFMAFIADDGVLFRPTAVKGKQWMTEHPVPSSNKRPLLSWYPAIAGMARAGDLGYTTGPWEFKNDIHDDKPVAWGHFLTVWKKQPVGDWKFAVDLGISNSQPASADSPWKLPLNYRPKKLSGRWHFSTDALLARDRKFSADSAKLGAQKAFANYAVSGVRLYREGKFPLLGKDLAAAVLPGASEIWTWEPAAGDVSITDDLGYTYGSYRISGNESAKIIEAGNYFRIWKKEGGAWKVLFDLTNPISPEEKKS